MRIAVVGAGALGLYYGALLQRAGHDLHFVLRRDYEAITSSGLKVFSPNGDFQLASVNGYRSSDEIGIVDLVLVGLKTYANPKLAELVKPLVGSQTAILTLQNGLGNEDLLARHFGAGRVVGGIAFLCCNRGEPGTVHHLDQGRIRLAELAGAVSPRLEQLQALFNQAGVPCEACPDLTKIRWEKLVWNIPFNGLCALTGLATDRLLSCIESRRLVVELMREVIRAGNAQELSPPIETESFIAQMLKATEGMGPYRPSMMIDRLELRPLEIEAIYRKPLQSAASRGVEMVRVKMLADLLHATEGQMANDGTATSG